MARKANASAQTFTLEQVQQLLSATQIQAPTPAPSGKIEDGREFVQKLADGVWYGRYHGKTGKGKGYAGVFLRIGKGERETWKFFGIARIQAIAEHVKALPAMFKACEVK